MTLFVKILKNDLGALDTCIKELRKCEQEGKELYAKFALSFKFTKNSVDELSKKRKEIQELVNQLQQPEKRIEDIEEKIGKTYDEIILVEMNRERITKGFSLLRENLFLKITTLEQKVEECLQVKRSFEKFFYSNLNGLELYPMGMRSSQHIRGIRDSWKKKLLEPKDKF